MELNLIRPVPDGECWEKGDEEINGRLWRVAGPHDLKRINELKFICISYVWGTGIEKKGSFFGCKRDISDQTRPALTAAIKAAEKLRAESQEKVSEAFWIDAICIPQQEIPARFKTLESMGFIYNAASLVIIVLDSSVFEIIHIASSKPSPDALSPTQMQILEADPWISRVWTYQELINGRSTYFTSSSSEPHIVPSEKFFHCVGFSLSRYKRSTKASQLTILRTFPNLNNLEDSIGDRMMNDYFAMPALCILANMAVRAFDAKYPQNRLLACLGALTREVSWGPPSMTLGELSEKFMGICEGKGDYSFVFTRDTRLVGQGKRWRPDGLQEGEGPVHLVPVINWYSSAGETQEGYNDEFGFWLENMVLLTQAERMNVEVEEEIDIFLYGDKVLYEQGNGRMGILYQQERGESLARDFHKFLVQVGFKGSADCILCEEGTFFPQEKLEGKEDVELYAARSIPYLFGHPGLARWKEDGMMRYCAGVFTGIVKKEAAKPLLMI